jgi:hypothetical protein
MAGREGLTLPSALRAAFLRQVRADATDNQDGLVRVPLRRATAAGLLAGVAPQADAASREDGGASSA